MEFQHFFAYSVESGRGSTNFNISEHDIYDTVWARPGLYKRPQRLQAFLKRFCMAFLYGRAGLLTAKNGGVGPGQYLPSFEAPIVQADAKGYMVGSTREHHVFGLIGTALSKKISVFQSSSLKVVPISPNASYPSFSRNIRYFHRILALICRPWIAVLLLLRQRRRLLRLQIPLWHNPR